MVRKESKVKMLISILLSVVFIPVIIINITLITKSFIEPNHIPDVLGISPVIVLSGSMDPEFDAESLIFIEDINPEELKEGDIITYLRDEVAVTHRIVSINNNLGSTTFTTRGDANNTDDLSPVTVEQIEGKYIGHIDGLGGVAMFMQSPIGMALCIGLPLSLYFAYSVYQRNTLTKSERMRTAMLEKELALLKQEDSQKSNVD